MPQFTIPDETTSLQGPVHSDLAEPKSRDFEALAQRDTGVVSGCEVTAQSTPNMTLAVASGVVRIAGVNHAVTAGNVTITANATANPRYDAVVVNTSGVKSVIAGTAAPETTLDDPAIDLELFCWLKKVYVAAGTTAISATEIVDKSIPQNPDAYHNEAHALDDTAVHTGTLDEPHALNAAVHTGTLDDAQIPSTIARDTEVTAAVSGHAAAVDPHGDRAYADGLSGTDADFALTGIITPAAIGLGGVNNYNPTGLATASTLRLSTTTTASQNISGLAGGADGRLLLLHNVGAGSIALLDESASSTAANRFALAGDMILTPDSSLILQYDATSSRWRAFPRATAATNPGLTFGTTNVGGTSPYFVRSDDQLALFDATAPVTQVFGDAAATGSSGKAADRAHRHGMPANPLGLPLGLTGAVAPSRFVGGLATTINPPTSGTFTVGDFVVDAGGHIYVCTVGGSPGTWVLSGGGAGGIADDSFWTALGDIAVATANDAAGVLTAPTVRGQILAADDAGNVSWKPRSVARNGIRIDDDMLYGGVAINVETQLGSLTYRLTGTGAAAAPAAGEANHPGVYTFDTGSTSTGRGGLASLSSTFVLGGGRARFGAWVKTPSSLADASQSYELLIGFTDSVSTTPPTDAVYWYYNYNVNGGKWQQRTYSNGSTTVQDSGVTVAASTWYFLEAEVNAAGTSVQFYINGSAAGSPITATIPVGTGRETGFYAGIVKTVGNTSRVFSLDAYYIEIDFTTNR